MGGTGETNGGTPEFKALFGGFVEKCGSICGGLGGRCCVLRLPDCQLLLAGVYVPIYSRLGIQSADKFGFCEVEEFLERE
jgi:hypothetical protein